MDVSRDPSSEDNEETLDEPTVKRRKNKLLNAGGARPKTHGHQQAGLSQYKQNNPADQMFGKAHTPLNHGDRVASECCHMAQNTFSEAHRMGDDVGPQQIGDVQRIEGLSQSRRPVGQNTEKHDLLQKTAIHTRNQQILLANLDTTIQDLVSSNSAEQTYTSMCEATIFESEQEMTIMTSRRHTEASEGEQGDIKRLERRKGAVVLDDKIKLLFIYAGCIIFKLLFLGCEEIRRMSYADFVKSTEDRVKRMLKKYREDDGESSDNIKDMVLKIDPNEFEKLKTFFCRDTISVLVRWVYCRDAKSWYWTADGHHFQREHVFVAQGGEYRGQRLGEDDLQLAWRLFHVRQDPFPEEPRCLICLIKNDDDAEFQLYDVDNITGSEKGSADAALCDDCEEIVATYRCEDCDLVYCETCNTKAHRKGKLRSHMTQPLLNTHRQTGINRYGSGFSSEIEVPFKCKILPYCTKLPADDQCEVDKHKLPVIEENVIPEIRARQCILDIGDKAVERPDIAPRTIMMLGATGAGKSTLIDGLVNHVLGVTWEDEFRFTIIDPKGDEEQRRVSNQAYSQTDWITTYIIPQVPGSTMPLNIIDLPGFGDTAGIGKDKELVERIRKLFETSANKGGIETLDMASFVVQASNNRLTVTQKYIWSSLTSIFDKSIASNICAFITFADGKAPQVLGALNENNTIYTHYFTFNNSALFARKVQGDAFSKLFWDIGCSSYTKLIDKLEIMETKSLQLSKEVLHRRHNLQITIQNLRRDVKLGLGKLNRLVQEYEILESNKAKMQAHKDFTYMVTEQYYTKDAIPRGKYVTNCLICGTTCHYPCAYAEDGDKYRCSAMNNMGTESRCTQCPKACSWKEHVNDGRRFVLREKMVRKTYGDIMKKYHVAREATSTAEGVVAAIKQDFDKTQMDVFSKMEKIRECIDRLKEIALSFKVDSQIEYIKLMIQAEAHDMEPGYDIRIRMLNDILEELTLISELKTGTFNPWGKYINNLAFLNVDITQGMVNIYGGNSRSKKKKVPTATL